MTVTIQVEMTVRPGGEVVIRHVAPDADDNKVGTFGVPARDLTEAEAMEVVRSLPEFIRNRFAVEAAAALAASKK